MHLGPLLAAATCFALMLLKLERMFLFHLFLGQRPLPERQIDADRCRG